MWELDLRQLLSRSRMLQGTGTSSSGIQLSVSRVFEGQGRVVARAGRANAGIDTGKAVLARGPLADGEDAGVGVVRRAANVAAILGVVEPLVGVLPELASP